MNFPCPFECAGSTKEIAALKGERPQLEAERTKIWEEDEVDYGGEPISDDDLQEAEEPSAAPQKKRRRRGKARCRPGSSERRWKKLEEAQHQAGGSL